MSDSGHKADHGHTPAAWTAVTIIFLGSLIGAVGTVAALIPVFWVGVVVMVAGGIVGKAMSAAGLGAKPKTALEQSR